MEAAASRFDRYEILAPLGAGGMGEVVKARALGPHGFEKLVAIKRIRAEWAAQASMAERFIREARIAARLQHANIVQVFDFGRHEEELFIVMEFVDGQGLDDILHRLETEGKRPTLAQSLQITLDVVRALDSAHTLTEESGDNVGVVHRDVSPANILISRQGVVKLTDFGIAAWTSGQARTSMVAGKPLFMSPEQLRGDALDGRADLFAVGLVLYQMLTGQRPWPGLVDASPETTLESMGYEPPTRWTTQLPEAIDGLTAKLLALDVACRPTNAREVMKEILQISYASQIVLDSSELAGLVGDPIETAHAPTVPQYQSKPETLIAKGVSPDGVTLLAPDREEPAPAEPTASATEPERRSLPWLAAVVVALLVAIPFIVWRFGGAEEVTSTTRVEVESESPSRRLGALAATEPSETEPSLTQPSEAEPSPTQPSEAEPSEPEPARVQLSEPEPPEAERSEPEPAGGHTHGRRSPAGRSTDSPREPTPAASGTGHLDVFSRPWAQIFVDGVQQSRNAPARGLVVPAGRHTVRLVNPVLGLAEERTVDVPADGRAQLRVFLTPEPTPAEDPEPPE